MFDISQCPLVGKTVTGVDSKGVHICVPLQQEGIEQAKLKTGGGGHVLINDARLSSKYAAIANMP